jgi:uncharacterized integral membrane protein (TIGR00698 family)
MEPYLSASGQGDYFVDPRLAASLNSMEGVPDWPDVAETPVERSRRAIVQHRAHQVFQWLGTLLPGVALVAALAAVGAALARWIGRDLLGFAHSPVSDITVATLLGLAVRNSIGLPPVYESGLRVTLRWILRGGIVLLGLRLSLVEAGRISLAGAPILLGCIAASLLFVSVVRRALGVSRRLGSLIAVGTSICGVSAIVATGPVVEAEEEEVSYAVACITIFGMLALFAYPFLAHLAFAGDAARVGLFLGTAIHDTAQVAGAGLMYQQQFDAPQALDVAAVTKLVRNLSMAAVIPLIGVLYHRRGSSPAARRRWSDMVPLFVVGFVLMTAARSAGDWAFLSSGKRAVLALEHSAWQELLDRASALSAWCLTVAMTAVGLGTGIKKLSHVGLRPLLVGLAAALAVGGVSWALIKLFAPWM